MLVKFGDKYCYDTSKALTIIFTNDEERLLVANRLLNMQPKEGIRMYSERYNESVSAEQMEREFDKIEDELIINEDGKLSFPKELQSE